MKTRQLNGPRTAGGRPGRADRSFPFFLCSVVFPPKKSRQAQRSGLALHSPLIFAVCAALQAAVAWAQPAADWTIETVAGTWDRGNGGAATAAPLYSPAGVATDADGNFYIADAGNHRIHKVAASTGNITAVAGSGERGFGGDGEAAAAAQLDSPGGIAVDGSGNLYIADTDNHRIRKVDAMGTITTVAGDGAAGFDGDGEAAAAAQLDSPGGVAVDGEDNLYIVDTGNFRIRKVDASTGNIATVAGDGTAGYGGDGEPATMAQLRPTGAAVDGSGNIYIADGSNHRIRKVDAEGNISTIAGTGESGARGDGGAATAARLNNPSNVALDGAGNLYIASGSRIRKVDTEGIITTVAGGNGRGFSGDDGVATAAQLDSPQDVAVDGAGNLYIADTDSRRIRKVDAAGTITTAAGTWDRGDGGAATAAQLLDPQGVAADGEGNLYVADTGRIRKVDAAGNMTTVAGSSGTTDSGYGGDDEPASQAQLTPRDVAVDGAGNLYIADGSNHRVRKVDAVTGTITTFAGNGTSGARGDGGPATEARVSNPRSVAVDGAGNLYIAAGSRIRKVDTEGIITTVAGGNGAGFSGDNDEAIAAQINSPRGVAVDGAGNFYIADTNNHRIRKVDAEGTITTVAGDGTAGNRGDGGPAVQARLSYPWSVAVDGAGNLYIAAGSRSRKVDTEGIITTVAGGNGAGFSGDGGAATAAQIDLPRGVAVDGAGNFYIADTNNRRVRRVSPPLPTVTLTARPPTIVRGESAMLEWTSTYAVSAELDQGIGAVAVSGAHSVSPAQTTAYAITVRNANGVEATASATVTVRDPPPTVTLSAAQTTITSGQSTTLEWSSTGAVSAELDQGIGAVAVAGMRSVSPTQTTAYTITVRTSDGQTAQDSVAITVSDAPTASLSTDPTTITGGQSSTLTWSSTNGATVTIDNGIGAVAASGSQSVSPTVTTTYTLTVTDANGFSVTDTATVTVSDRPTATLTADPTTITSGQSSTLRVASTNAVSAVIQPGDLTVTLDGSGAGSVSVSPTETTTYTLTVTDANGFSVSDTAMVTVSDAPAAVLTADPATITRGQSSTLTWSSTNGATVTIDNGIGAVAASGSQSVSPTVTTTYTLTVTDANGFSVSDTAMVTVSDAPTAVLSADPTTITRGQSSTLTWSSTNGATVTIDNGIGAVAASGSQSVSPTVTTTYTLTVTDANNVTATATATVTVTDRPTATLTADPTTITSGQSATLQVASTNAVSAVIQPGDLTVTLDGSGAGSVSVSPTETTTYTLTVTDANNATATATAMVTVSDAPTAVLTADPTTITRGQPSTLTWSSTNGAIVTIDNGIGAVAASGSQSVSPTATTTYTLTVTDANNATATDTATITVSDRPTATLTADPTTITSGQSSTLRAASTNAAGAVVRPGNLTVTLDSSGAGSVSVSPTATTEYTLTVTDANSVTATDTATVTVSDRPTAALTADPATIAGGQSSTLRVTSTNAAGAVINPGNLTVALDGSGAGSVNVSPAETTTYTLTVTDANGFSVSDMATITVSDALTAVLTADPATIASGRSSTLTWSSANAVSAEIDQGIGAVALSGMQSVSPAATTTYTLTVSASDGGTVQAQATVTVNDPPPPPVGWTIETVAGTWDRGNGGAATAAPLYSPAGVAADLDGNFYIADAGNHRIHKIDAATGNITAVAGSGERGFGGDGEAAAAAQLDSPGGIAVDGSGNLYIADTDNHRIRKVDAMGTITTVAGDGAAGFDGDGEAAAAAQLDSPGGVAVDGEDNLYIVDTGNFRIRKVDASTGNIATVAGDGTAGYGGDGEPAIAAQLRPTGAAVDVDGNLYIADGSNHRIRKVDAEGTITTVAGNGMTGHSGDGSEAVQARVNSPRSVAADGAGNLYIASGSRIRKVDTAGIITTAAGGNGSGFSGDGQAARAAQINLPRSVAVDGSGNLYIADTDSRRIRKVDAAGIITTVAGTWDRGDGGAATAAQLLDPQGVAADGEGNLYVADTGRIRKIDAAGNMTTVAGSSGTTDSGYGGDDEPASQAQLTPRDVAVDGAGNLYIADGSNHRVRKVDAVTGTITTFAGNGTSGARGDNGPATLARVSNPRSVAVDGAGNLYIASGSRIRKVDAEGIITTAYAGASTTAKPAIRKVDAEGIITTAAGGNGNGFSGDGESATAAQLNLPRGVAADGAGNFYIADTNNERIRKVDAATGNIATVAGTGEQGYSGDNGAATAAQLSYPTGVEADRSGNLYIADAFNFRIRKVDAEGNIATVAGDGTGGFSGDSGPATAAQLNVPYGVAPDGAGNLYIADTDNHRIRKIDAAGNIATVAGTGQQGYGGDSGAATAAQLNSPYGVAPDESGNLYIADTGNHRIRKVDAAGNITTVAGDGTSGFSGDNGPAIAAQLNAPFSVALDESGHLYIADAGNHRIRWVDAADGNIATVAGTGQQGFNGNGGPATQAQLDGPYDVAVDLAGNIYIADAFNGRIRKVSPPMPAATLIAAPAEITAGQSTTLKWTSTNAVSAEIDNGVGAVSPPSAGSATVSPTTTTTYTLTVANANNVTARATAAVTVAAAPTATLSATDTTITRGQSTTLQWTSTNAVSAEIDQRVGAVSPAAAGAHSVSPSAAGTIAYTLTVTDNNGVPAAATATLTVQDPSTLAFSADDASITAGQSTTLRWTASNANSAEIDNGIGAVSPAAAGAVTVSPAADTTYTLTVTDNNGSQAAASVTITVADRPAVSSFTVTPSTITLGQSATLAWAASGDAITARIDQRVGAVSPATAGAHSVSPSAAGTIAYTLTVTDSNGVPAAATATLTVTPAPTATLSADPTTITGGQSSTLTWSSTNGAGAEIDPGIGMVALSGSRQVSPTVTTTYTLTVTHSKGAQATASVTITVSDAPPPPVGRTIETVAGDGIQGFGGDGSAAAQAQLDSPPDVAVDGAGNLYIADGSNHRVRKVDAATGKISTVAGTGAGGSGGDGGAATAARVNNPVSVAVDGDGNLYTVSGHRIRKIDAAGIITTVAGGNGAGFSGDCGPADQAQLRSPRGVAVDRAGNFYIADTNNHRIRKVDAAGTIATVAGNGMVGSGGDGGPAVQARVSYPQSVAVDGAGNLYIAGGSRIRKVDTAGIITTAAGGNGSGFSGDGGAATAAQLNRPRGVAVDGAGGLYIADSGNHRIRRVDAAGTIATVAGSGAAGFNGDGGPATAAQLNSPQGAAVAGTGNLYIADTNNHRIRKVDASTVFPSPMPETPGFQPQPLPCEEIEEILAPAVRARAFKLPFRLAQDDEPASQTIVLYAENGEADFVAQPGQRWIAAEPARGSLAEDEETAITVKVDPSGLREGTHRGRLYIRSGGRVTARLNIVLTVLPPLGPAVAELGVVNAAVMSAFGERTSPFGAAALPVAPGSMVAVLGKNFTSGETVEAQGFPLPVSLGGARVLFDGLEAPLFAVGPQRIEAQLPSAVGLETLIPATVETGEGVGNGDGGPATAAQLESPRDVALDGVGNLYIADGSSRRVRKVDAVTGIISTTAGTGVSGAGGDGGPATAARLSNPASVAVDGWGNFYIAGGSRIRKVDTAGMITTVAGGRGSGFSGDGDAATAAQLNFPRGVAADGAGNLYIADTNNRRIRKVDAAGTIATVAGNGRIGATGDGGPATAARLTNPASVAVDRDNNLYITAGSRIRKVDAAGIITTVAGGRGSGFSGDGGPATRAQLSFPRGVAADGLGNLYIADTNNHRIRKVDAAGIITTAAGSGAAGFSGDGGPAAQAQLSSPRGVAADGLGNLYIADTHNRRIRRVDAAGIITTAAGSAEKAPGAALVLATVVVETPAGSSYPRRFFATVYAPGIFTMSGAGTGQAAALFSGEAAPAAARSYGGASRPARAGDTVEIYATGLGPAEPPLADGMNSCEPDGVCLEDFSNVNARRTIERPRVWIGGVEVAEEEVLFSGLAPTLAAVNVVVVEVPPGIEPSDEAEVVLAIDGKKSQPGVTIAVE